MCALWRPGTSAARPPISWAPPAGEMVDLALRARTLGTGADAVLLLHGLAGSNRYYGAAYDSLSRHGRLIAVDLLGFGHSPKPSDADYGPGVHVERVIALLEQLGVRRLRAVVGHSAGALLALHLAHRWRERVESVVALSPPLYRDRAAAERHVRRISLQVRLFAMDGLLARWSCRWMCAHRERAAEIFVRLRPELPAEIARDGVLHHWESYSRTLRNVVLGERMPALSGPDAARTLLLAGDGDPVVDLAYLREWSLACAQAKLERWPGDHDLPLRSAECIVRRISEWIEGGAPHAVG